MVAYDYPLLGILWTMLVVFLWVAWIILVFRVIVDVFRSRDMGGVAKALWAVGIVLIPWLGVLVYLIARGSGMAERDAKEVAQAEQAAREYVRSVAGSAGVADELTKLAALRDGGVISAGEFEQQKTKLLS